MPMQIECPACMPIMNLVDVWTEELQKNPPPEEQVLTPRALAELFDALDATFMQRRWLADHGRSAVGMHQPFTRSYVTTYLKVYGRHVAAGLLHEVAEYHALVAAINARSLHDALAAGLKPISREQLEQQLSQALQEEQ